MTLFKRFLLHLSKPLVTSKGPFVEYPSFRCIGKPCNSLQIDLPQASAINVKTTYLSALSGDPSSFHLEDSSLHAIQFKQLMARKSCSAILGSPDNKIFHVLRTSRSEKWAIQKKNIFAWSNVDLNAENNASGSLVVSEGEGTVILGSTGNIFEVSLKEGETIHYKTSSLVASTVSCKNPPCQTVFLSLPNVRGSIGELYTKAHLMLKKNLIPKNPSKDMSANDDSIKLWIQSILMGIFKKLSERPSLYVACKGPGRVLLEDK